MDGPTKPTEWNDLWAAHEGYEIVEAEGVLAIRPRKGSAHRTYDPLLAVDQAAGAYPALASERGAPRDPVTDLAELLRVEGLPPTVSLAAWWGARYAPTVDRRSSNRAATPAWLWEVLDTYALPPRRVRHIGQQVEGRVLQFAQSWGLLGLRLVSWDRWPLLGGEQPWPAWERPMLEYDRYEPLRIFLEAAHRFSLLADVATALEAAPAADRNRLGLLLYHGFDADEWLTGPEWEWLPEAYELQPPRIDGISDVLLDPKGRLRVWPAWNEAKGQGKLGWLVGSLWLFLHVALFLGETERHLSLRRCKRERCGRFFVARNPKRLYCSTACQKA